MELLPGKELNILMLLNLYSTYDNNNSFARLLPEWIKKKNLVMI